MERESATARDEFHRTAFHQRVWRHFYFRHFVDLLSKPHESKKATILKAHAGRCAIANHLVVRNRRSRNSASFNAQPARPGSFWESLCGSRKPLCVPIGILTPDHNLSMELVKQRRVHFNFHVFSEVITPNNSFISAFNAPATQNKNNWLLSDDPDWRFQRRLASRASNHTHFRMAGDWLIKNSRELKLCIKAHLNSCSWGNARLLGMPNTQPLHQLHH